MRNNKLIDEFKKEVKELTKQQVEDSTTPSTYSLLKAAHKDIQILIDKGWKRTAIVNRFKELGIKLEVKTFTSYWAKIKKELNTDVKSMSEQRSGNSSAIKSLQKENTALKKKIDSLTNNESQKEIENGQKEIHSSLSSAPAVETEENVEEELPRNWRD